MRFALLAVLLSSCTSAPVRPEISAQTRRAFHELIVPESECRAPGPEHLRHAALVSDVDVLERLFARGYAGWDATPPAQWHAVFDAIRAELPPTLTPAEFRDLLAERLAFVDDNHVGLWSFDPDREWRSTSGHAAAYIGPPLFPHGDFYRDLEGRQLVSCALPEGAADGPIVRPVVDGTQLADHPIVLSRTPVAEVLCVADDGSPVSLPLRPLRIDYAPGPVFERLDAPFPWLRLRSLMNTQSGALDRFVASAETVRDAPVVVVDLRHTGGGSDRFLRDFFGHLSATELAYWHTGTLRSDTMLQGSLNFWTCVRASSPADGSGRAWLDARILRAEREIDAGMNRGPFREILRREMPVAPTASTTFTGRLVLVVDRGCASACETAVVLARQLPGTIVIGENTGGVMKVGELRWYRLPESRVWISLGHRSHDDPRDEFQESVGFQPDVWLSGEDDDTNIRTVASCLASDICSAVLDADHPR